MLAQKRLFFLNMLKSTPESLRQVGSSDRMQQFPHSEEEQKGESNPFAFV